MALAGLRPTNKVKTALIDMYAKCGSVKVARNLFEQLKEKRVDHLICSQSKFSIVTLEAIVVVVAAYCLLHLVWHSLP